MRLFRFVGSFFVLAFLSLSAQAQTPLRILDNGTQKTLRYKLNIIGTAVSCADNSGSKRTDCTWTSSVVADSPLAGSGTSASHLTCSACLTASPTTTGDMFYSTSGGVALSRLATPGAGSVLISGSTPSWSTSLTNFTLNTATSAASTAIIARTQADSHGTTITPQITLENSTAATAGNQKSSGAIELCGRGWKTTATAASQPVCVGQYMLPIEAAANPSLGHVWYTSTNGGARTARFHMLYDNAGTITYLLGGAPTGNPATSGGGIAFDSIGGMRLMGGNGGTYDITFGSGNFLPAAANQVQIGHSAVPFGVVYTGWYEAVGTTQPTCAVGAAAGTGATCAVQTSSSMPAGRVHVTTAGTPPTGGTIVTITAGAGSWTAQGHCVMSPVDDTTANSIFLQGTYMVSATTSTMKIVSPGNTALTTATTYKYQWVCIGGN